MRKKRSSLVVDMMYANDRFSRLLGIERLEEGPGRCVLRLKVRREFLNGFSIAHGGIAYSLADSALAFASNAHGRKSVSIESSISHLEPVREGDTITAKTEELSLSEKIGVYQITITNQRNEKVALFRGTVYRTSTRW